MTQKASDNKRMEMVNEWNSWEHILKSDVKRLDDKIQFIYSQMSVLGVPKDMREPFVVNKLLEIIKEVTA